MSETTMKLDRQKVQKLRNKQCWSQEELASASGLSVRTIQRVEKSGAASIETTKALAAVFYLSPSEIIVGGDSGSSAIDFIIKLSGFISLAIACTLIGAWVIDILIPTLKGANFNAQYELHGNFRYLDFASVGFVFGFVGLSMNLLIEFLRKPWTKVKGLTTITN